MSPGDLPVQAVLRTRELQSVLSLGNQSPKAQIHGEGVFLLWTLLPLGPSASFSSGNFTSLQSLPSILLLGWRVGSLQLYPPGFTLGLMLSGWI